MSSGGSSTPSYSPYPIDASQMQAWMQTPAGQQYSADYNPNQTYGYNPGTGQYIQLANDSGVFGDKSPFNITAGYKDVTGMMAAFQSWMNGNNQTAGNWASYAQAANSNQGGEGTGTITQGAAVGQASAIYGGLGTLANGGNTPTAPTTGLGSMGALSK